MRLSMSQDMLSRSRLPVVGALGMVMGVSRVRVGRRGRPGILAAVDRHLRDPEVTPRLDVVTRSLPITI
jgi:hypothetical protein